MSTRFFICLCFFVSSFGLQGQMLWPGQYLLSSSGTLNALDQNQQHLNVFLYHELSGQFHTALSHLRTTHALALPIGQNLSIGLGMQVQLLIQPKAYGSYLDASARLGCQYQFADRHRFSMTLNEIGVLNRQQISLEHVVLLRTDLFFAQGFSWNPNYQPSWYLTIIQKTAKAKLQFSCGIYPQRYSFSYESSSHQKLTWFLAQSWQYGLGLGLQFGFIFH